jgi:hypothetical protein
MLDTSLKDTFNELAALEEFMREFASAIPIRIKLRSAPALIAYKRSDEYTAIVESRIRAVKRNGPESEGYEEAARLLKIFLHHADENTGIIMQIVGKERLASYTPKNNLAEIKSLAARHNLNTLQKLLD